MSAEVETGGPEQIELHFCHRCGISIPQSEIDLGRAQPVPGGFICIGCSFQESGPAPVRRVTPAPRPARDTGARVLTVLALLYVVGVTTFLLARELTRPAPAAPRDDLVARADLDAVSRKLDVLDEQARTAFAELKGNDVRQRDDLAALSGRVAGLAEETPRSVDRVHTRLEDLESAVLALGTKTGLLKEEVAAAASAIRNLRDSIRETPVETPKKEEPKPSPNPNAGPPAKSAEELEHERLVKQYLEKLTDKNATNQTRYNAAVQLGDLRDPAAIPGLVEALKNDSYNLVRRAAAWSLGMFGRDAVPAIPALIAEIGGKEEYVGYMCERALGEITKAVLGKPVSFNFDPTMNSRQRKKVQKDWEEWWEKNRAQLLPEGGEAG